MKIIKFPVIIFSLIMLTFVLFLPCRAQNKSDSNVIVLCYHSFLGKGKIPTDVGIDELKMQLESLKKQGYKFVSFSEMANGRVKGTKNVLITIDDGNHSILEANEKVFKPMGIKPLLGIYPNIIGKKDYALNWEELKKLSDSGFDIASHGYYHLLLNDKLYNKDKKGFEDEIFKSKKILEEKLGRKIDVFVYPNGVRSDNTKRTLKEAGYNYAFTIVWGNVLIPLNLNPDALELHRYMVSGNWKTISGIMLSRQ